MRLATTTATQRTDVLKRAGRTAETSTRPQDKPGLANRDSRGGKSVLSGRAKKKNRRRTLRRPSTSMATRPQSPSSPSSRAARGTRSDDPDRLSRRSAAFLRTAAALGRSMSKSSESLVRLSSPDEILYAQKFRGPRSP